MYNYDDNLPIKKDLVCKCYRCDKDIPSVTQYWDFYTGMFRILIKCHGQEQMVVLSESQVDTSNRSGWYWAFMDRA